MIASNITKDVRGVQRVPASVMNPTVKTVHVQDRSRHQEYTQEHQDNICNKRGARNQPSTASRARTRSVQVKRRWIIGPAAALDPAASMKMGPHTQLTSLTYKRSLTPAGSNTHRWSISFPLFCSLRVELV
jgi:hypothetical protein